MGNGSPQTPGHATEKDCRSQASDQASDKDVSAQMLLEALLPIGRGAGILSVCLSDEFL